MADSTTIFDDFTEAARLSHSVCQQVSAKEYEEDISSETDKALGDLCLYLDQHPEVYANVLRKRKQEEMETGSLVSFVKSKVLKIVHGDDFAEHLVSTSECMQQTNSLKAGLCKTFQYSQEIKGSPNKYNQRLTAKRNARAQRQNERSRLDITSSKSHKSGSLHRVNTSVSKHKVDSIKQTTKGKPSVVTPVPVSTMPSASPVTACHSLTETQGRHQHSGQDKVKNFKQGHGDSSKEGEITPQHPVIEVRACSEKGDDDQAGVEKCSSPTTSSFPASLQPMTLNCEPPFINWSRQSLPSLSSNTNTEGKVLRTRSRVRKSDGPTQREDIPIAVKEEIDDVTFPQARDTPSNEVNQVCTRTTRSRQSQ